MSPREILIVVLGLSAFFSQSQSKVDSLLNVAKHSTDTIVKIDALNELAFALRNTNADTVILIAKQSKELSQIVDYQIGFADANTRHGIALTALGNYYQALQLFLSARAIYEELEDKQRYATVINNIGRIYNFMENYDLALKYYEESVAVYAELGILIREADILNNIGYIHKLRENYSKSLEYLNLSIRKSDGISTDKGSQMYPIYNKGSVFMKMDKRDSAMYYLDMAIEQSKELRDLYIASLALIDYGQMYIKMNQLKKAESSLKEAFEMSIVAGLKNEGRDAAKYLSEVYERQGNLSEALRFYKIFKEYNDSLFNGDLERKVAFQEAEFTFNQKQIQEENERKKRELERDKDLNDAIWVRNTLLAGLVVMILICYLLYENFRRKRMANQALKRLNIKIESQSEELKRANLEITTINSNLETIVNKRTRELKRRNQQLKDYLSSNSHIVRAPLARILGLVDLYEPTDSENLDFINESLQASAKELDDALHEINRKLSEEPPS